MPTRQSLDNWLAQGNEIKRCPVDPRIVRSRDPYTVRVHILNYAVGELFADSRLVGNGCMRRIQHGWEAA